MSTTTSNYELIKPELTDSADITVMNLNWDKIDEELKKKYDVDNKPTATDVGAIPLYTTLAELGLPDTVTTNDICVAMPPYSRSTLALTNSMLTDAPTEYVNLEVIKLSDARAMVRCEVTGTLSPKMWFGCWHKDSGWSGWKRVANADEYLALSGGTLSGNSLGISGGHAYLNAGSTSARVMYFPSISDSTNARFIGITNQTSGKNKVTYTERVNGTETAYGLYGEHNKPSGSYTGNNSATSRTISVGGIGEILVITSDTGTAWVSSRGAICMHRETGTVSSLKSWECYYKNGTLTIATNSAFVNGSLSYWYQIL